MGINTSDPQATLHINGNIRIQNPKKVPKRYIDGTKRIESAYIPLFWHKDSHEIFSRDLEYTYIVGKVTYTDGDSNPTIINLDPDRYDLFVTGVSIENNKNVSREEYRVGVENKDNSMPIKTFEVKSTGSAYSFKAFFKNTYPHPLHYYKISDASERPDNPNERPVWVARFIAIDKNHIPVTFDITVDYNAYWDCATCGGKYGIELGKYFKENPNSSSVVSMTVSATEETTVE